MTSADWAAWTQAIAAAIALAVGVGVPIWQRGKEDERRVRDDERRAAEDAQKTRDASVRAYGLANLVAKQLDKALATAMSAAETENPSELLRAAHAVAGLQSVVEKIELLDLMPESVEELVNIQGFAREAAGLLQVPPSFSHLHSKLNTMRADLRPRWNAMNKAAPPGLFAEPQKLLP